MYICRTYIQYFKLLLTFIMHSATIKTLELIHFQIKIPKGGQAKAKEGRMLPPPPLKETLWVSLAKRLAPQTSRSEYGPKIVTVRGCKKWAFLLGNSVIQEHDANYFCYLEILLYSLLKFELVYQLGWTAVMTAYVQHHSTFCTILTKTDGYLYTHHYCLHNISLSLYSEKFPVLLLYPSHARSIPGNELG